MENLTRQTVEVKIHSKAQDVLSLSLCSPKKRAPDKDNDPFRALSVPNRLRAREASRKSQCRERFEVRGILKSKEEQIVGPCLERVELK